MKTCIAVVVKSILPGALLFIGVWYEYAAEAMSMDHGNFKGVFKVA